MTFSFTSIPLKHAETFLTTRHCIAFIFQLMGLNSVFHILLANRISRYKAYLASSSLEYCICMLLIMPSLLGCTDNQLKESGQQSVANAKGLHDYTELLSNKFKIAVALDKNELAQVNIRNDSIINESSLSALRNIPIIKRLVVDELPSDYNSQATVDFIVHILKDTNLQSIELNNSAFNKLYALDIDFKGKYSEFTIYGYSKASTLPDSAYKALRKLTNIKYLHLYSINIPSDGLDDLCGMNNINSLYLDSCILNSSERKEMAQSHQQLDNDSRYASSINMTAMNSLQELSLLNCVFSNSNDALKISLPKSLKSLAFSKNEAGNTLFIAEALRDHRALAQLKLIDCGELNQIVIDAIKANNSLRVLELVNTTIKQLDYSAIEDKNIKIVN